MAKKCRVRTIAGETVRGKLLKDKTASGFVEKGEARYIKQGGQGANVIQFTDPNAEAKFLRARKQSARDKKHGSKAKLNKGVIGDFLGRDRCRLKCTGETR